MDEHVKVTDIRNWSTIEQGGTVKATMRAIFYIGRYGPFTEHFDLSTYTLAELETRIALLQNNLPNRGL